MNNPEEDKARSALLEHFSAKSTAQTAILVGLAVASFADFQAVDVLYKTLHVPLSWIITFLVFSIGLIIFLVIRSIGKLIYYGGMADAIPMVDKVNRYEMERILSEEKPRPLNPRRPWQISTNYLVRLSEVSTRCMTDRLNTRKGVTYIISRITSSAWFDHGMPVDVLILTVIVAYLYQFLSETPLLARAFLFTVIVILEIAVTLIVKKLVQTMLALFSGQNS